LNIPLVSIITVNFNGLHYIKGLLESLSSITYPNTEIILVDNASTDGSVAYVRKHFPEVKIIENAENYFFARGNNIGIARAKGKYYCLINNDVKVDPGFLEPLVELCENHPDIGACQPKVLNMEKPREFEYAGAAGGYLDFLGYPFLRGRIFDSLEIDEGQYDDTVDIFWASGACLFLRAAAIEEGEVLDESFQMHMEEIDLSWRLHLWGWEIAYQPLSRVWHHGGGTLSQTSPQKMYWNFRNNIFLLVKNFSALNLILRLPVRLLLDIVAVFYELAKLQYRNALAIVRAYGWLISHIGLLVRKRWQNQKKRKFSDREVLSTIYPGSIVLEYFLLGRRKISQLLFYGKWRKKITVFDIENIHNSKQRVREVYE